MRQIMTLILLAGALSGCGSMRITTQQVKVNATAFRSSSEILVVLSSFSEEVKRGRTITKEEVFARLHVNRDHKNVEVLRKDTVINLVYGSSFVAADRADLREEIARYSGVQIPFTDRLESGVLSAPFHIEYFESGYDVGVVLLFDKGKLMSADHFGLVRIDRNRRALIFNPFSSISQSVTNQVVVPQR